MDILILTLVGIALFVGAYVGSIRLLESMNEFYNETQGSWLAKTLLFIPYMVLWIWCIVVSLALVLITLGGAASAVSNLRDWWHKGN